MVVGFTMQFVFGVIVLRWKPGYDAIKFVSDVIIEFIEFAYDGAAAVFGDPFLILHPFVFMVMYRSNIKTYLDSYKLLCRPY